MQITSEKAQYTRWLLSYLGAKECNYIFLASCLNSIEFYYTNENDKNRVGDAKELREKYIDSYGEEIIDNMPAAVTALEVLASLAIRADWVIRETPYTWFLIFIENLGMDFLTDTAWTNDGEAFVVATIHKWFDRRFSPNGSGSPFRSSKYDLTNVSIWDAMQWYLADEFGEEHL